MVGISISRRDEAAWQDVPVVLPGGCTFGSPLSRPIVLAFPASFSASPPLAHGLILALVPDAPGGAVTLAACIDDAPTQNAEIFVTERGRAPILQGTDDERGRWSLAAS
jgi:hypothetical protein